MLRYLGGRMAVIDLLRKITKNKKYQGYIVWYCFSKGEGEVIVPELGSFAIFFHSSAIQASEVKDDFENSNIEVKLYENLYSVQVEKLFILEGENELLKAATKGTI